MSGTMRLFVSSSAFLVDPLENPDELRGIKRIELSGRARYWHDAELDRRLALLAREGMEEFLVHNYFPIPSEPFVLNFATSKRRVFERCLMLASRAIDLCVRHDVPYYTIHPGYLMDSNGERVDDRFVFDEKTLVSYASARENFLENVKPLCELCASKGIGLAIENMFPRQTGTNLSLNVTADHLDELMERLPIGVGILLDLGHLNVASNLCGFDRYGYLQSVVRDHGDRIYELHLSANDGQRDRHLPLAEDDWQIDVLSMFVECPGFRGRGVNITIESMNLDAATLGNCCALVQDRLDSLAAPVQDGSQPVEEQ